MAADAHPAEEELLHYAQHKINFLILWEWMLMVKTCKKAAVTFAMFVHLSTCHQLGNWWIIASLFFKFDVCGVLLKCVYVFHFWLQLGRSAGYFTLKTMYISAYSSVVNHWICFRIRNILNINCRKEYNTIYAQERFSSSISFLGLIKQ